MDTLKQTHECLQLVHSLFCQQCILQCDVHYLATDALLVRTLNQL